MWLSHERYGTKNLNLSRIIKNAGGSLPKAKIKEDLTNQEALDLEVSIIRAIGRKIHGSLLVNLTDGGDGTIPENHWDGESHPEAARAIGRALKGRKFSKETKRKMSVSAKKRVRGIGGKYSTEHADAIRKGVTRFWAKRRRQYNGSPPSLRSKAGHKKHGAALRAHYANLA